MSGTAILWCRGSIVFLLATLTALGNTVRPSTPGPAYNPAKQFAEASRLIQAGLATRALGEINAAYERAVRYRDARYQLAFLILQANAHNLLYQYRPAIRAFHQAAALARQLGRADSAAVVAANLSHTHLRLGQFDLAYQEATRAFALLPSGATAEQRAQITFTLAELEYQIGKRDRALELFRSGLEAVPGPRGTPFRAEAHNRLGYQMLRAGDITAADAILIEGFRLRRTYEGAGLESFYRNVGMLRLAQGDVASALSLLDQAVAQLRLTHPRVPGWTVFHPRAQARAATGDFAGALADYEQSVRWARAWRAEILPGDEVQTVADVELSAMYSDYMRTALEADRQRPDPELPARVFTIAEENRALSLRQDRRWTRKLPPRYWEILAQARELQMERLHRQSDSTAARLRAVRGELARLETAAGLPHVPERNLSQEKSEKNTSRTALLRFRQFLRPSEALLSFHLGEKESFLWTLTRSTFHVHRLPPRGEIASLVRAFREALAGGEDSRPAGLRLRAALFGSLEPAVTRARSWVLSADDSLFGVPFAALPEGAKYLVEQRDVRLTPSAYLLDGKTEKADGAFVALADPVYNAADPRAKSSIARQSGGPLELARIPASAKEARRCAAAWGRGSQRLLLGPQAGRQALLSATGLRPSALHLATHVVSGPASDAMIALSLTREGKPDYLSTDDIANQRTAVPLVVMSGCSSGRGRALPGAGLTGLTRAWLLAGSRAVAASHWPTPDDTGALMISFYKHLQGSAAGISARQAAAAMRSAQIEMIQSRSWRAKPAYWAAFFLLGRD